MSTKNILDRYKGELKFETGWLRIINNALQEKQPSGWFYVCCLWRIRDEFVIPKDAKRLSLVFSTDPNEGIRVHETHFYNFVRDARGRAGIDPAFRQWCWSVALDK